MVHPQILRMDFRCGSLTWCPPRWECLVSLRVVRRRTDIEKYIKLMGLDVNPMEVVGTQKHYKWGFVSGPFDIDGGCKGAFPVDDNMKVKNKEERDGEYSAVLDDYGRLYIHFTNPQWMAENENRIVMIFDLPFDCSNVFNTTGYIQCDKCAFITLTYKDDSDAIAQKVISIRLDL